MMECIELQPRVAEPNPPVVISRNLQDLPVECLLHIFSFLPSEFVATRLVVVSKRINQVILSLKVPFRHLRLFAGSNNAAVLLSVIDGLAVETLEMRGYIPERPDGATATLEYLNAMGKSLKRLKFDVQFSCRHPEVQGALMELVERNRETLVSLSLQKPTGIDNLATLPELKRLFLQLARSEFSSDAHQILQKTPKLESFLLLGTFSADFWSSVTYQDLKNVTKAAFHYQASVPFHALKNIQVLSLLGVPGQGFGNVKKSIKGMPKLKHLFLHVDLNSNMEPFGIGVPGFLKKLPPGLLTFVLSVPRFSDSLCSTLADTCPKLETFICFAPAVTVAGVGSLLKGCGNLRRLAFSPGRFTTTDCPVEPNFETEVPKKLRKCSISCNRDMSRLFGINVRKVAFADSLGDTDSFVD